MGIPLIEKILRSGEQQTLKKLDSIVSQVNQIEPEISALSDIELREQTEQFRQRLHRGEPLENLLTEAYATVREASRRTLGQRHYDVQIMGGTILHWGNIAEMQTGEGKTLVATLPSYLNALTGLGVHVVTVNDYLAERDAEWMGRIHRFLGLEVGVILSDMDDEQRRKAYAADITYGTNNEFGFDYLRDNMVEETTKIVQRGHHYAIIDEVDSILIDEARTPLIISGEVEEDSKMFYEFSKLVEQLERDKDYIVDEKKQSIAVKETAINFVEEKLELDNLYRLSNAPLVAFLMNALKAKELFEKDKNYVIDDSGELLIVDEHTGRILPNRRWSEGQHQAIEAKENLEIRSENQTLATTTLQNYFRLYDKLSGMTGTAQTEAAEFGKTYGMSVFPIPTNKPSRRVDYADLIYQTEAAKYAAIVEDVVKKHDLGQPVLIGTASVLKSEILSTLLSQRKIKHNVLNAKNNILEGDIVAQAGRPYAVTVSTNMAGRGTDILLGGNPEFLARQKLSAKGLSPILTPIEFEEEWSATLDEAKQNIEEAREQVASLGGLYVIGTERYESRRIDNQLRGRAGRQGDPGETRFYLSLEDDLVRIYQSNMVNTIIKSLNLPEEVPLQSKMVSKAISNAQTQREQQNFESRKNVLEYDDILDKQRLTIYGERKTILEGIALELEIQNFIQDTTIATVEASTNLNNNLDPEKLDSILSEMFSQKINLEELFGENPYQTIEDSTQGEVIEKIVEKLMLLNEENRVRLGEKEYEILERKILLSIIDQKWREHLLQIDHLRNSIGLRAYAQKDPLVEYRKESVILLSGMLASVKETVVRTLLNLDETNLENVLSSQDRILENAKYFAPSLVPGQEETLSEARETSVSETAPIIKEEDVTAEAEKDARAKRVAERRAARKAQKAKE